MIFVHLLQLFVFLLFFFRELCNLILERHGGEYQLGTTKVFLRENLERSLERDRAAILRRAAVILQRWVRGFLARKHYQMSKKSAIKLQSAYRYCYFTVSAICLNNFKIIIFFFFFLLIFSTYE